MLDSPLKKYYDKVKESGRSFKVEGDTVVSSAEKRGGMIPRRPRAIRAVEESRLALPRATITPVSAPSAPATAPKPATGSYMRYADRARLEQMEAEKAKTEARKKELEADRQKSLKSLQALREKVAAEKAEKEAKAKAIQDALEEKRRIETAKSVAKAKETALEKQLARTRGRRVWDELGEKKVSNAESKVMGRVIEGQSVPRSDDPRMMRTGSVMKAFPREDPAHPFRITDPAKSVSYGEVANREKAREKSAPALASRKITADKARANLARLHQLQLAREGVIEHPDSEDYNRFNETPRDMMNLDTKFLVLKGLLTPHHGTELKHSDVREKLNLLENTREGDDDFKDIIRSLKRIGTIPLLKAEMERVGDLARRQFGQIGQKTGVDFLGHPRGDGRYKGKGGTQHICACSGSGRKPGSCGGKVLRGGSIEVEKTMFMAGLIRKLNQWNSSHLETNKVYETDDYKKYMAEVNRDLMAATNNGRNASAIQFFLNIPSVNGFPKAIWKATLRALINDGLTVFNSPILTRLSPNRTYNRLSEDDPASGEENEEPEDAEYSVPTSAVPYRPDGGL